MFFHRFMNIKTTQIKIQTIATNAFSVNAYTPPPGSNHYFDFCHNKLILPLNFKQWASVGFPGGTTGK